jgi:hypothetical protein
VPRLAWLTVPFLAAALPAAARSSSRAFRLEDCPVGKTCEIPVQGMRCADGSPGKVYLTRRAGAENLLVYLDGGGACWSRRTCDLGYALRLSADALEFPDWDHGPGVWNGGDEANPFSKEFSILNIPYCSGDAHAGARVTAYAANYKLIHQGFKNTSLGMAVAKELFPDPKRAVLMGCSAGGIGVLFHQRGFEESFPGAKKYVIDDAGTPFFPPHVSKDYLDWIRGTWGADKTAVDGDGRPLADFRDLAMDNIRRFPNTRWAFVSSYLDAVMGFFARNLGSSWWPGVIRGIILGLADHEDFRRARAAHVYYRAGFVHCLTNRSLQSVESDGVRLGDWLSSMVFDDPSWSDVRPDLAYAGRGQYPEGM